MLKRAGIEKKISPHNCAILTPPTGPTPGPNWLDIEAPPGHWSIASTPIDADGGQERMEKVVARL